MDGVLEEPGRRGALRGQDRRAYQRHSQEESESIHEGFFMFFSSGGQRMGSPTPSYQIQVNLCKRL
jgi:hypothetical protein